MIRRLLAATVAVAGCSGSEPPALPPAPVITGLPANGAISARHEGTASMESDLGATPSWSIAGNAGILGDRPGSLPAALAGPSSIAVAPAGAPNAGALALAEFADNAVVLIRP